MSIVVNSTPLISLAVIRQLGLLPKIFGDVILPRAVHNEIIKNGKGKIGHSQLTSINGLSDIAIYFIFTNGTKGGRV